MNKYIISHRRPGLEGRLLGGVTKIKLPLA